MSSQHIEDILHKREYHQKPATLWQKWIAVGKKSWSHVMVSMSDGRPMVFASDHEDHAAAKEEKLELIRLCGFEDGDEKAKGVKRA